MENKNIEVRFPNESFYDKINIKNVVDFKASKKFSDEVFGYLNSSYVAIKREDYEKLVEEGKAKK